MELKRKTNDSVVFPAEGERIPKNPKGEETILNDGDNMNRPHLCRCIFGDAGFEAMMGKLLKPMMRKLLKPMMQKLIQEEFPPAFDQSPRLTTNLSGGISEAKQFQLAFSNELKQKYYTQHKMLAEHDAPIRIVLWDVGSRSIVTTGPMSSLVIEICVLSGDFGSGDHQDWSSEQFNANIIAQTRPGKPSELLMGDTRRITLKDGVALIGKIEFTDNSSWDRTGTFRLAAKSKAANVREAISQPFTVQDKRGAATEKHAQPSLNSEIWRLRHIGKKTHKKLSDDGIETVKDFLRLHTTNPTSLKEKFGKLSSKTWDDILENARACAIDDNVRYIYHAREAKLHFVFNSIYKVVRVSFDGGPYRSPETFTPAEQRSVDEAKKEAYENDKFFEVVDLELLATPPIGQSNNGIPPYGGAPQQVDPPANPGAQVQQGQGIDGWNLLGKSEPWPCLNYSLSSYQGFPSQIGQSSNGIPPDGGAPRQVDPPANPSAQVQQGQGIDGWNLLDKSEPWQCLNYSLSSYQGSPSQIGQSNNGIPLDGGAPRQVDLLTTQVQQEQDFDDWAMINELLHPPPRPYLN